MPALAHCPDVAILRRFALGEMPLQELEPVAEHVETCDACASMLSQLPVRDTLTEDMHARPTEHDRDSEAVAAIIARLKSRPPWAALPVEERTVVAGSSLPPDDTPPAPISAAGLVPAAQEGTEVLYTFLSPPQGPDALGRLGDYRILKVLGTGGMGVVFEAEDTRLRRRVALKVMRPEMAAYAAARGRFLREAQAAARLDHDHIVAIHQVGEAPSPRPGDGRTIPYLIMPLLQGESLETRLQRDRRGEHLTPLPAGEAVRIGREVAEGLAAAHEAGLVHRDIKPANLWLERGRGRVKVLDFGLARAATEDAQLTQQGSIVGTPAYMAPEQARGEKADARSDLFSLGCVLYRMATGQAAFRGSDPLAIVLSLAQDTPTPPRQLNPELPPALADLILRLLAKDPARRPPSARAVADELAAIERATTAPVPSPEETTASVCRLPAHPAAEGGKRPRRRSLAALWGLALLAGVVAVIVLIIRDRDGKEVKREVLPEELHAEIKEEKDGPAPKADRRNERPPLPALAAGEPLWPGALVRRPAKLPGVRGWSIEKRAAGGLIGAVAYRPDGKRLAAASREGQSLRIWDPESGRLVQILGARGSCKCLAWSPDGRVLAAGAGGAGPVQLWEAETGRFLRTLALPLGMHTDALAWSPDGRKLLAAGRQECLVWDAADGKLLRQWLAENQQLQAFSPDCRYIAGWQANPPAVVIREAETGKKVRTIPGHGFGEPPYGGTTWSPDGKRLAYGGPGGLFIWETETGKEVLRREDLKAARVVWSPDGRAWAVAAINNNWQKLTELGLAEKPRELGRCGGPFAPDGKSVVGCACLTGTIHLLDPVTGRQLRTLSEGGAGETSVALAPDGRTMAFKEAPWRDTPLVRASVDTGQVLVRRDGLTAPLAFSPDGKLLAAGGPNNTVVLSDDSGKERARLTSPTELVGGPVWSPDGKRLAFGNIDRRVLLWDTEKVELLSERGPFATRWSCYPVAWSPDGRLLAIHEDAVGLHLWDTAQNKLVKDLPLGGGQYTSLPFTPDGQSAVVGDRANLQLVDLATGKVRRTLACWSPTTGRPDVPGAFSPDGRWLGVAADSEGAYLVQGDLRRRLRTLEGTMRLMGLAVVADGKLVAGWGGERLHLWEADTGRMRGTLLLGERNHGLAITPEGHYTGDGQEERGLVAVVQKEDGTQELLEPADFEQKYGWKNEPDKVHLLQPLPPPLYPQQGGPLGPLALVREPAELPGVRSWTIETRNSRKAVSAAAYRPDGKLLATGGADGTIRLWDTASGQLVRMLVGEPVVVSLAWSKDGKVLAAGVYSPGWPDPVRLWDTSTGRLLRRLPLGPTFAWSPAGPTLASIRGGGQQLALWDDAAGALAAHHFGALVEALDWSPDGKTLALGLNDQTLRLWDVASAKETRKLAVPKNVRSLAWSPDGKRLVSVAPEEGAFGVWDVAAGKVQGRFPVERSFRNPPPITWLPDGKTVAIGFGGFERLFDVETGRLVRELPQEYGPDNAAVAWSPDGKQVVLGCNRDGIQVWDAGTGKRLHSLGELDIKSSIDSLAWSPDGLRLALLGYNHHSPLRIIEAATGQASARPSEALFREAAWSPDGSALAAITGDHAVGLWDAVTARPLRTLEGLGQKSGYHALAWSPDSTGLAGTAGERVCVWSAPTGRLLWRSDKHSAAALIAWSPDGRRLATADAAWEEGVQKGGVRIWEVSSGQVLHEIPAVAWGLAWSPDGKTLAVGRQTGCQLFDAASATVRALAKGDETRGGFAFLRWSPDGRQLTAMKYSPIEARVDYLYTWDSATGLRRGRAQLSTYLGSGLCGAWSSDGRVLARGFDHEVHLFDAAGWPLGVLLPGTPFAQLAVTADGHYRGSARVEREIRMVVLKNDGTSETLTPAEFEHKYGFKNEPDKVRLTD